MVAMGLWRLKPFPLNCDPFESLACELPVCRTTPLSTKDHLQTFAKFGRTCASASRVTGAVLKHTHRPIRIAKKIPSTAEARSDETRLESYFRSHDFFCVFLSKVFQTHTRRTEKFKIRCAHESGPEKLNFFCCSKITISVPSIHRAS